MPEGDYQWQARYETLCYYSEKSEPVCSCCGETIYEFLCLDHVDGNAGGQSRGRHLFLQLRREGFPKGYQVLCYNCNNAKQTHGVCPHKQLAQKE